MAMAQRRWDDDESLLADLGEALAFAAPREAVLDAGRQALTWRTVDEELASLSYDSLLDDRVMVRGAGAVPRSLVFDSGSLSVELELDADRIVGQLVPAASGKVVVQSETVDVVVRGSADTEGCFTLHGVPSGTRVRLRCSTGSASVVTDWVRT